MNLSSTFHGRVDDVQGAYCAADVAVAFRCTTGTACRPGEIKFQAPHAIDAMFSPSHHLIVNLTHCLISTQVPTARFASQARARLRVDQGEPRASTFVDNDRSTLRHAMPDAFVGAVAWRDSRRNLIAAFQSWARSTRRRRPPCLIPGALRAARRNHCAAKRAGRDRACPRLFDRVWRVLRARGDERRGARRAPSRARRRARASGRQKRSRSAPGLRARGVRRGPRPRDDLSAWRRRISE